MARLSPQCFTVQVFQSPSSAPLVFQEIHALTELGAAARVMTTCNLSGVPRLCITDGRGYTVLLFHVWLCEQAVLYEHRVVAHDAFATVSMQS